MLDAACDAGTLEETVRHVDDDDFAPVTAVGLQGDSATLQLLVDAKANVYHQDCDGTTPLHCIAYAGKEVQDNVNKNVECIDILVKAVRNTAPEDIKHECFSEDPEERVRKYLDLEDEEGNSALLTAAVVGLGNDKFQLYDIASHLLSLKASADIVSEGKSKRALMSAISANKLGKTEAAIVDLDRLSEVIIDGMVANGLSLDSKGEGKDGECSLRPLEHAVLKVHKRAVLRLVQQGADVNIKSDQGQTLLERAKNLQEGLKDKTSLKYKELDDIIGILQPNRD